LVTQKLIDLWKQSRNNMKLQTTIKLGFLAASLFALNQGNAQQKPGLNLDLMDKSVRPNDDFSNSLTGHG